MIALIQRVTQAKVEVKGQIVGQIGKGLLVLLGVEKEDDQAKADKLAEKVLNYRIFSDENEFKCSTNRWRSACGITIHPSCRHAKRTTTKFLKRCRTSLG